MLSGRLSFAGSAPWMLLFSLGNLALLVVFAWLFAWLAGALRPGFNAVRAVSAFFKTIVNDPALGIVSLIALLALTVLAMALHELAHGVFFWLFTGERPKFGLTIWYAYAGAPEWYLPRGQYLIVGLAPLVLITLGGLLLVLSGPFDGILAALFVIVINAAGAVGDMAVTAWVLLRSPRVLVNDTGDTFSLYEPGEVI
jgi:hypothetical protein